MKRVVAVYQSIALAAIVALAASATALAQAAQPAPPRLPERSMQWTMLARHVGESESARDRAVAELRRRKGLDAALLAALDGPDRPLALDVIVALKLKKFIPELVRRAPADKDGFLILALSSMIDEGNKTKIFQAYLNALAPDRLPGVSAAAIVAMLEPLGRAGVPLPKAAFAKIASHEQPEARAAALYYLRLSAVLYRQGAAIRWLSPFLADPAFQNRIQAMYLVRELARDPLFAPVVDRGAMDASCATERNRFAKAACRELSARAPARAEPLGSERSLGELSFDEPEIDALASDAPASDELSLDSDPGAPTAIGAPALVSKATALSATAPSTAALSAAGTPMAPWRPGPLTTPLAARDGLAARGAHTAENTPEDASCQAAYQGMYAKGLLSMRIVFGYKDARPARFVGDRHERLAFAQRLLAPCGSRADSACGFRRDPGNADLFLKDLARRPFLAPPTQVRVVLVNSSVGSDDALNRLDPFQEWRSHYAERAFLSGIERADVALYNGHSRFGGGPDFSPPKLNRAGEVDTAAYLSARAGLQKIRQVLRHRGAVAARAGDLRLLGLFSCASTQHFAQEVAFDSKAGLVSSQSVVYWSDALATSLATTASLLEMRCARDFRSALRESAPRVSSTIVGFFK